MLKVKARFYSFEGANARHEHEYHVWESVQLPAGKVLISGVITHASNIVELIAERLVRYAKIVGGENVIASTDCGFSSQACYKTEVHPKVIWEKFKALAAGARLASKQIWGANRGVAAHWQHSTPSVMVNLAGTIFFAFMGYIRPKPWANLQFWRPNGVIPKGTVCRLTLDLQWTSEGGSQDGRKNSFSWRELSLLWRQSSSAVRQPGHVAALRELPHRCAAR